MKRDKITECKLAYVGKSVTNGGRQDSTATPLLTTKFHVRMPCPNLVSRPHLIQPMDEALRPGYQPMLISAPAGFGKTTLTCEWISDLGYRITDKEGTPEIRNPN